MPIAVKIVGSTPTTPAINESEVVGVLDTEQNKQIYEARVVTELLVSEIISRTYSRLILNGRIKRVPKLGNSKCMRFLALHWIQPKLGEEPHLPGLILDLVVQLVRISACHAEGHEFESRLDRSYKLNTTQVG